MIIDVFQDTICPWCRIGKKHLFDAMLQWKGEPISIRYRTYLLNHDTPKEGYPFREFMSATKGGPQVVEQMVKLAPENKTSEVVEAIYKAYFEDGQDIGNIDVLVDVAVQQGLNGEEVRGQILADAKRDEIQEDLNFASELQLTGVPFFVIDGNLGLSGAHPVETFLKAFHKVSSSKTE